MRRFPVFLTSCIITLIVTSFGNMLSQAALFPAAPDLEDLTRKADLIVVGKISDIHLGNIQPSVTSDLPPVTGIVAEIGAVRTIKGEASSLVIQTVISESTSETVGPVNNQQFGIFFLKQASQNTFIVLDRRFPIIPALPTQPFVKEGTVASSLDRVVAELTQVLLASRETLRLSLPQNTWASSEYFSGEELAYVKAVDALCGLPGKSVNENLVQVTQKGDQSAKLLASATLLMRGDISGLSTIQSALMNRQEGIGAGVLTKTSFALRFISSPDALPALSELLNAPDKETRKNVTQALRRLGAKAIVPMKLALQDSDSEVRYEAIMGLAETTKQWEWAPALDLYTQNEQKFLRHWLEWSSNH
jgi:hypothetical protein